MKTILAIICYLVFCNFAFPDDLPKDLPKVYKVHYWTMPADLHVQNRYYKDQFGRIVPVVISVHKNTIEFISPYETYFYKPPKDVWKFPRRLLDK